MHSILGLSWCEYIFLKVKCRPDNISNCTLKGAGFRVTHSVVTSCWPFLTLFLGRQETRKKALQSSSLMAALCLWLGVIGCVTLSDGNAWAHPQLEGLFVKERVTDQRTDEKLPMMILSFARGLFLSLFMPVELHYVFHCVLLFILLPHSLLVCMCVRAQDSGVTAGRTKVPPQTTVMETSAG